MSAAASTNQRSPLLVVLSGPSGAGKDAVLARMKDQGSPCHFTVTATTRRRRNSERDGVHYIFVSDARFRQMIDARELLEWAEVYGYLYGVPKSQVADALAQGKDVIIKTDVQGAATIRRLAPEALFIFLAPPSIEELARRLSQRMTEPSEALRLRIQTAEAEMEEASEFDHVVVNRTGTLDVTVHEIEELMRLERRKERPRKFAL